MKNILASLVLLFTILQCNAQTTYTVTANTNWNGVFPSYCNTCTFNISTGIVLTVNTGATCYHCIVNGGIISLTSDFTFQFGSLKNTTVNLGGKTFNLQSGEVDFINSVINGTGNSKLTVTGNTNPSLVFSGSTLNFSGNAQLNNGGGTLNIGSSHLYFYGSSSFYASAGPVNLSAASQLVAGDGSVSSNAFLKFDGPQLNLSDAASAVYIANKTITIIIGVRIDQ